MAKHDYGVYADIPEFQDLLNLRNIDPLVHHAFTLIERGESAERVMCILALEFVRDRHKRMEVALRDAQNDLRKPKVFSTMDDLVSDSLRTGLDRRGG